MGWGCRAKSSQPQNYIGTFLSIKTFLKVPFLDIQVSEN